MFFPTVRPVPLERNLDQTRQVNHQPSARHSINGNDFIAFLGRNHAPAAPPTHPAVRFAIPFYSRVTGSSILWM